MSKRGTPVRKLRILEQIQIASKRLLLDPHTLHGVEVANNVRKVHHRAEVVLESFNLKALLPLNRRYSSIREFNTCFDLCIYLLLIARNRPKTRTHLELSAKLHLARKSAEMVTGH